MDDEVASRNVGTRMGERCARAFGRGHDSDSDGMASYVVSSLDEGVIRSPSKPRTCLGKLAAITDGANRIELSEYMDAMMTGCLHRGRGRL